MPGKKQKTEDQRWIATGPLHREANLFRSRGWSRIIFWHLGAISSAAAFAFAIILAFSCAAAAISFAGVLAFAGMLFNFGFLGLCSGVSLGGAIRFSGR